MNVYFFFFFLVLRFAIYDYMMHKISITFVDYFPYSGYFFSIPFWTVFWNPVTRESKLWESLIRCFTYLARNLFLHSNHFNLVFFPLDLAFTKKKPRNPKKYAPRPTQTLFFSENTITRDFSSLLFNFYIQEQSPSFCRRNLELHFRSTNGATEKTISEGISVPRTLQYHWKSAFAKRVADIY